MRLGTLFSGIGAPEFAAANVFDSPEYVFACDNDPYVKKTFLANHKVESFFDDILSLKVLPYVDVLIFGPPCQSFSVAGKRLGTQDLRGQLLMHANSLVRKSRPKFFILENVKGLMTIDGGTIFKKLLASFRAVGYHVSFTVRNALECGLPQHRERIWVIGSLVKQVDLSYTTIPYVPLSGFLSHTRPHERVFARKSFLEKVQVTRRLETYDKDFIPCITQTISRDGSSSEYISYVAAIYHAISQKRKPTVSECKKLFGFPATFRFPSEICITRRYNMFANSMAVPVVSSILRSLII